MKTRLTLADIQSTTDLPVICDRGHIFAGETYIARFNEITAGKVSDAIIAEYKRLEARGVAA